MLIYCLNTTPLHQHINSSPPLLTVKNNKAKLKIISTVHLNLAAAAATVGFFAAAVICVVPTEAFALPLQQTAVAEQEQTDGETLSNIPRTLSSDDSSDDSNNNRSGRIKKPKSSKAEYCTIKCVGTCIRGGYGAPGEGPLNVRRPLVVFKEGFRSRHYCLVECSDICNLMRNPDDGP